MGQLTASIDMLEVARTYYKAGLAVIPPRDDGSKAPIAEWKQYQEERPEPETVMAWYRNGREGIGCITGAVSGNLELFEFDDYAVYLAFCEAGMATGLDGLIDRISTAYSEATPNGGVHWYYRCATIQGNTKLAQRPKTPEEMKHPKDFIKVLIETRGEGGFSVMAPSYGATHNTGYPYKVLKGKVEDIPTITEAERELLWGLARTFNQIAPKEFTPRERPSPSIDGDRPGDLFAQSVSWRDILEPHGWTPVFQRDRTTHWRRPGKDIGTSATTGHTDADTLMVFSSSTEFETAPESYSKFAAYAVLNHEGDYQAASKALWQKGYRNGATTAKPDRIRQYTQPENTILDEETGEIVAERFQRVLVGDAIEHGIPEPEWIIEGIFLKAATCVFYGEGGNGKTMLLLALCLEIIRNKQRVLFVDEEGGVKLVGSRLEAMGATPEELDEYLFYYPFSGFGVNDSDAFAQLVEDVFPALVVFDAMSDLLMNSNLSENNNDEVTRWMTDVPFRIARHTLAGPGVVVIDHVAKNGESKGHSRGATQKKNIADYQWYADTLEPFDQQTIGKIKIEATKNRFGNLPEQHTFVIGGKDGDIIFERFNLAEHGARTTSPKAEKILETIYTGGPMGNAQLRGILGVSDTMVGQWLNQLVGAEYLEKVGAGRMTTYQLTTSGIAKVGERIAKVGEAHS